MQTAEHIYININEEVIGVRGTDLVNKNDFKFDLPPLAAYPNFVAMPLNTNSQYYSSRAFTLFTVFLQVSLSHFAYSLILHLFFDVEYSLVIGQQLLLCKKNFQLAVVFPSYSLSVGLIYANILPHPNQICYLTTPSKHFKTIMIEDFAQLKIITGSNIGYWIRFISYRKKKKKKSFYLK